MYHAKNNPIDTSVEHHRIDVFYFGVVGAAGALVLVLVRVALVA